MSDSITHPIKPGHKADESRLSFLDNLSQQPYVTNLNQFLAEESTETSLQYWIDEFIPASIQRSQTEICFALNRAIAELDDLIEV